MRAASFFTLALAATSTVTARSGSLEPDPSPSSANSPSNINVRSTESSDANPDGWTELSPSFPKGFGADGNAYVGGAVDGREFQLFDACNKHDGVKATKLTGNKLQEAFPGNWPPKGACYYESTKRKFDHPSIIRVVSSSKPSEELRMIFWCADNYLCTFEKNTDEAFHATLIGDGNYDKMNKTIYSVAKVGREWCFGVNATLPWGKKQSKNVAGHITAFENLGWVAVLAAMIAVATIVS